MSAVEVFRIVKETFPSVLRRRSYALKCNVYTGIDYLSGIDIQLPGAEGESAAEATAAARGPVSCVATGFLEDSASTDCEVDWVTVVDTLISEVEAVRESESVSLHQGPLDEIHLSQFSMEEIKRTMQIHSPRLWSILEEVIRHGLGGLQEHLSRS
eukprot:m.34574 g.34574  ORF g.34574 m.34574 type:complete len:156 (+) comp31999_c0_seq2:53-520(+)